MSALRDRLFDITAHAELGEHVKLIESLKGDLPHTIVPLESPYPIEKYTCVVHAFDLTGVPEYEAIAGWGLGRTFAGAKFVQFLLGDRRLIEVDGPSAGQNRLVMYFADGKFQHVGKVTSTTRVTSKWGTGHLFEHDVLDVPSSYGSTLRYFEAPTPTDSLDMFYDFAETMGVEFREHDP